MLPIFILKLAYRDNDENNNCHRQEDINPHHDHIASNNGIARELTLGCKPALSLVQCGSFPPIYPDDGVEVGWVSRNFGRWRFSARQVAANRARPGMGVAAEYPDGQAVGDPIVNTDAAPAGHKIIAPYLEPDHQA